MLKTFLIISYLAGAFCAALAILRSRTPQGATAWVLSLLSFPFLAIPIFILFGRIRFEGYNSKRRILASRVQKEFEKLNPLKDDYVYTPQEMDMISRLISPEDQPGFTLRNKITLLKNADEAFPDIMREIENAQEYIIFQFYVVRGDSTGKKFIDALIRKAKEGIKVTFMNDAIGVLIPGEIMRAMKEAGIETGTFNESTHKGRFQVNFRNHRKVVVVDGRVAFLGGLNIGDEYVGLKEKFGFWRDTNVKIEGPSVLAAQLGAAKDWYCIHERPIKATWEIRPAETNSIVMVLNTGPADDRHMCLLSYMALINAATKRLWIANPYYVPPESLMDAILLAKLRGVDVRILLPSYSDARFVMLASRVYQKKLLNYGIRLWRYTAGFLHQKVMIVDNEFAVVGSVNFDFRSMFINFENSIITNDKDFIAECSAMLEQDFRVSQEMNKDEFAAIGLTERIVTRGANLLAPVL